MSLTKKLIVAGLILLIPVNLIAFVVGASKAMSSIYALAIACFLAALLAHIARSRRAHSNKPSP